jgi:hypothetical protein
MGKHRILLLNQIVFLIQQLNVKKLNLKFNF